MMTDENGKEFPVTQNLFDTLELSKTALLEEVTSKTGSGTVQEATEYYLSVFLKYHTEQMVACMDAIGKLESRVMGLANHLGAEEFEFSDFEARIGSVDPDTAGE